jgi:hypothetical protein
LEKNEDFFQLKKRLYIESLATHHKGPVAIRFGWPIMLCVRRYGPGVHLPILPVLFCLPADHDQDCFTVSASFFLLDDKKKAPLNY